jgi:hypothetical protein
MAPENSSPTSIDRRHNAETDWPAVGSRLHLAVCLFLVESTARPPLVLALSASAPCREPPTAAEHVSLLPEAVVFGRGYQRTPRHTTHLKDLPERVRITRPQHPFDGKALAVFGRRRYQGKPHLILILPDGSRSLIPTEWTDFDSSTPDSLALPKQNTHLGFVTDLLHTRSVVDALLHRCATPVNNSEISIGEENAHLATHPELSRHSHPGNPGLGNAGERAKDGGDRGSGSTDRSSNRSQSKTGERS